MIQHWLRRTQPVPTGPAVPLGQWPIALWQAGATELGDAINVRPCPARAAPEPDGADVFLTDLGLQRPLLVLGADSAANERALLRLAARVLEQSQRRLVYVQGEARPAAIQDVCTLLAALGRSPHTWLPWQPRRAAWFAASDAALHRRLRELLLDTRVMQDDAETVDLILHSILSLTQEPVRSIDDLCARCRTLYAYAAQMQSELAPTAMKVVSLTALLPPGGQSAAADAPAAARATWEPHATRRRTLEWATRTDLRLVAEVRDLLAARLMALTDGETGDGWQIGSADTVVIALPSGTTGAACAQRRFVLEALLHDLTLALDPDRPITLILDGVREVQRNVLPALEPASAHASQTLIARLRLLPALAERGLSVVLSAPHSQILDPDLHERLLAANPLAIIHATATDEPLLEARGGWVRQSTAQLRLAAQGGGLAYSRTPITIPAVPACRARGLGAHDAYLVTGHAAARVQLVPLDLSVQASAAAPVYTEELA